MFLKGVWIKISNLGNRNRHDCKGTEIKES